MHCFKWALDKSRFPQIHGYTLRRMSSLSIVHEFSVLYSSRVLQKDKKWSDGRLRYYELNNKLEVFGEDMLLVGTDFYPHHARKPLEFGVFAEGNSYTLPGGKLILEINEYLGSFERDISNIFVKKDLSVKPAPDARFQQIHPETVSVKSQNPSKYLGPKALEASPEPHTISSPGKLSKPSPGRPVGLRRKIQTTERQSPKRAAIKMSVGERLDASYFSVPRGSKRIPPGSNKFSRRLKFEAGMSPVEKEFVSNDVKSLDDFSDVSVSIDNAAPDTAENDLDDIMNLTQKYGGFSENTYT